MDFVLGLVMWVIHRVRRAGRRRHFPRAARELGLHYSRIDPFETFHLPFPLFSAGSDQGSENVLSGTGRGFEVRVFDYWFSWLGEYWGISYTYLTCALTEIPAACPFLSVERENVRTRARDQVGLRDIDFESEAFNRAFDVRSEDTQFARAFIDARMMQWMLERGTDWAFQAAGGWLLCTRGQLPPSELGEALTILEGFRAHVPRVVFDLYGSGPTR